MSEEVYPEFIKFSENTDNSPVDMCAKSIRFGDVDTTPSQLEVPEVYYFALAEVNKKLIEVVALECANIKPIFNIPRFQFTEGELNKTEKVKPQEPNTERTECIRPPSNENCLAYPEEIVLSGNPDSYGDMQDAAIRSTTISEEEDPFGVFLELK